MQALIDFLIRNLLALWPIYRVYEYQHAFRLRGGHIREELAPGLGWRLIFLDQIEKWPKSQVAVDLASGAITCKGGDSVAVSANIRYRMTDIRLYYRTLHNGELTLRLALLGMLCSSLANREWAAIYRDRAALEGELLAEANTLVTRWGFEITAVNLTDCLLTKGSHHTTDGSIGRATLA